jgi:hypothetical protein
MPSASLVGSASWRAYLAGHVQRWHTNPALAWTGQTVGHHQWGVACLILMLFPGEATSFLLREALTHDCGEGGTCDLARPVRSRYPHLAHAADEAGEAERLDLGFPAAPLTHRERGILGLCDRLEAILFVAARTPHLLDRDDWRQARDEVLARARALGVGVAVDALLVAAGL